MKCIIIRHQHIIMPFLFIIQHACIYGMQHLPTIKNIAFLTQTLCHLQIIKRLHPFLRAKLLVLIHIKRLILINSINSSLHHFNICISALIPGPRLVCIVIEQLNGHAARSYQHDRYDTQPTFLQAFSYSSLRSRNSHIYYIFYHFLPQNSIKNQK